MNVLFMSLSDYKSINVIGLYTNLLRQFVNNGDSVYVLSPVEKKNEVIHDYVIEENNSKIVKFQIGNIQKANFFEKGISTLSIPFMYIKAIKKYLSDVKFDLILYPTPPITFLRAVEYVKKRDKCFTYLLLKDIFPQNAVDIGVLSTTGIRGMVYRYFKKQEKKLYRISDCIGCMSPANVDYLLKENPEIEKSRVEVCPNTTDPIDYGCEINDTISLREKYGIPTDKMVFVYGGNLGKPQDIPFVVKCLETQKNNKKAFFLIIGSGTDYFFLQDYLSHNKLENVKLMNRIPKEDYDKMIGCCDVGLIFLDHRFTIPNFPSRMLAYMQAKIPILAVTDPVTDIGKVITEGEFGWWCISDNPDGFSHIVNQIVDGQLICDGNKGFEYLKEHYTSEIAYNIINKSVLKR